MTFSFLRPQLAALAAYQPHTPTARTFDKLDTNENPYDLPVALKEKLAALYQQEIHTNRYPSGSHAPLKAAIADYAAESASLAEPLTADWVSVGNGSDELIRSLLIATCLDGAGSILVADPTFSMYGILAQTLGIPVARVPRHLHDFSIDLDAANAAITASQAETPVRIVFVVHPNSPTANALTPTELAWLRDLPPDILVAIDEAYFEFHRASVLPELRDRPNWIILRTFSKAFRLAAHRVGYCLAHPEIVTALEKVRLPYNLPSFSQSAALLVLYERQTLLEEIDAILAERDRLQAALQLHPKLQVWPSGANFIYWRLRGRDNEAHRQLMQDLEARGTLARHTGGGIRLTVGTHAENTRTLNRLQALLG